MRTLVEQTHAEANRIISQAGFASEVDVYMLADANQPPSPLGEIPWGHNIVLLFKIADRTERLWYATRTLQHGWSRAILTVQIESNLHSRQGKAVSNFTETLPSPQSDLVQQTLKDPYIFDFLTLHAEAIERDLESGLVDHIRKFLLEMEAGFAFVGQQVHIVSRFSARTAKKQLTEHRRDRSRIRASCNRLSRGHSNNSLGDELETMNDMLYQDTSK